MERCKALTQLLTRGHTHTRAPLSLPFSLCRRQEHAADVATQAISSLQREKHNLEVKLQATSGRGALDKLQATLNAVQVCVWERERRVWGAQGSPHALASMRECTFR
jgi:hypothetical protein